VGKGVVSCRTTLAAGGLLVYLVTWHNPLDEWALQLSGEAVTPNKYDATTHFVGQSTIFTLPANRGTGETYCLAHHVTIEGGKRRSMLASLRYLDTFVKVGGAWLFAERLLYVDWTEERGLA
jgi:SnoaL-like domain